MKAKELQRWKMLISVRAHVRRKQQVHAVCCQFLQMSAVDQRGNVCLYTLTCFCESCISEALKMLYFIIRMYVIKAGDYVAILSLHNEINFLLASWLIARLSLRHMFLSVVCCLSFMYCD